MVTSKQLSTIGIALAAIFFVIPFVLSSLDKSKGVDSGIPPPDGCTPVNLRAELSGELSVDDKKGFNFEPQPVLGEVSNLNIYKTLGFFKTDYSVSVWLVDRPNTPDETIVGTSDVIESTIWNNVVDKGLPDNFAFTVPFKSLDNDCDGELDAFSGQLRVILEPEGQAKTVETFTIIYENEKVTIV